MAECRVSVGNVEVLGLTDAEVDGVMQLSQLFPDVPAEAWPPIRERYPEVFSSPDTWRAHFGCYLLRSEGRTILFDTGLGDKGSNPDTLAVMFNNAVEGRLMAELDAVGVSPSDIDTVVLSHLHADHVGWNLSGQGANAKARFTKAKYVIHQDDWNTFKDPEVQGRYPFKYWEETLLPLESLGALDLISGERALTSEVTVIPTPGHTPGHVSVAIVSGGQHGMVMGDVAIHVAQIVEVDWAVVAEMDSARAAQTRRQFLDRAEGENAAVFACHFPRRGFGRVVRIEGRRYWQGL